MSKVTLNKLEVYIAQQVAKSRVKNAEANGNGRTSADMSRSVYAVFLEGVPVPYLLFMEKQLDDLQKFVEAMPTLDPSVEWKYNKDRRLHTSTTERKNSTRKERVNHVKFEGSDTHPPQVEMVDDEVLVGFWDTTRFSGAFTDNRKHTIIGRIMEFKNAVKFSREQANQTKAVNQQVGEKILTHLFAE